MRSTATPVRRRRTNPPAFLSSHAANAASARPRSSSIPRRCAPYRMEGGAGDFHGVGQVCDLEQQFFVEGGGNTVRFEPSSSAGGTYSYSGNMSGFAHHGHGTYTVKYAGRGGGEHHRDGSRLRRLVRWNSHGRGHRGVPVDAHAGRRLLVVRLRGIRRRRVHAILRSSTGRPGPRTRRS